MSEPCKLHIGNLSYDATEDDLRECCEKHGAVEQAIVVTDRDTGRPRGFGFVTFQNEEDAKNAIDALDATEVCGRQIKVSESRPRNSGGGGRGYGGRGGGRGYSGGRGGGGRGYSSGGRYGGGSSGGYSDRSYSGGRSDRSYSSGYSDRSHGGGDRSGGGYDYNKSGGSGY